MILWPDTSPKEWLTSNNVEKTPLSCTIIYSNNLPKITTEKNYIAVKHCFNLDVARIFCKLIGENRTGSSSFKPR